MVYGLIAKHRPPRRFHLNGVRDQAYDVLVDRILARS
jgi:hypothetical protein